ATYYMALCHMHGYGPEQNKEMALSIATYLHKRIDMKMLGIFIEK
ncbi:19070_t:CDS:1, partial [Racocetra persica]